MVKKTEKVAHCELVEGEEITLHSHQIKIPVYSGSDPPAPESGDIWLRSDP